MAKTNPDQLKASNPLDSVWVAASAGTGKTKVLTDRVLRLLLHGIRPETILCLTYTKAAASEMENRINKTLKEWALCTEKELIQKIIDLTQEDPDDDLIKRAQSLFALKLETPGGMKIMTIHAFCQSLLKRFPLEADVPPQFEVIDDLIAKAMREQILNDVLVLPDMQPHLDYLTQVISTNVLNDLFKGILEKASLYQQLIDSHPNGIETILNHIKKNFRISSYDSEKQIINEFYTEEEWPLLKAANLTKDNTILARKKEDPIAQQVYEVNERLRMWKLFQGTSHLLHITFRVLEAYRNLKIQMALLDYNDLLEKTNDLLSRSTMAAWVLYKLDGGIDHILLDEAQDTNKTAWNIVKSIATEFFSGEGQSDKLRTLFVVGDKKQSIFSFQGADPAVFEKMREHFESVIQDSQNSFVNVPLNYSFRSCEPIMRLVNYVLENQHAKNGVLFDSETAFHQTDRLDEAGLVEIWPVENSEKTDKPDPWKPPIEREESTSSMKRMIDRVANKITSLIGHEELPSKGRLIEPGDILILLQKRTKMMAEFVRALQQRNIPVAGVDRLILSDHLAIQDLMALTEFVLQPNNDLNLANLIKSPILNLTEDDLYKICVHRDTKTVWQQLQKFHPQKADILKQIMTLSDGITPFEFYGTLLGKFGFRKAFVARFGQEVNEALDEFLNLSVNFEQNQTPNLQKFLDWFMNHEIEIKRDLDNSGINAVRIMTVHGSKGLQGNIVFLPDTRSTRSAPEKGGSVMWQDGLPIWVPNKKMRPSRLEELFETKDLLANQEKRRLLYVALTRASDRLYICGCDGKQKAGPNNWYDLIKDSLPPEIQPDADGIIRWGSIQKKQPDQREKESLVLDETVLPDWALRIPPVEETPTAPLSPSKLGLLELDDEPEIIDSALSASQELAMRRGTLIHKLLQFLPNLPSEKRQQYIDKNCPVDIEVPNNLLEIFERSELYNLFGPTSAAEVPVVGTINGQPISGQIDRLVVLPNEVKIIDFKTNTFVPKTVPEAYKKQLNAYKDLLKSIFPDKMVHAYILWTQTLYYEEIK